MITVDFETEEIEPRPYYPPKPVGVSIILEGKPPVYYAWGHPTENNCKESTVKQLLHAIWESGEELLFHNGMFDVDVGEVHFGLPRLAWSKYHDTMFLLFLHDPHSPDLKLKPSSHRLLGVAPEEQEEVREWLIEHRVCRRNDQKWGRYISEAPGKLVGKYANGDSSRTKKLFKFLHKKIAGRGMQEAYDRERRLMPILLDNERVGIRVDTRNLRSDIDEYEVCLTKADAWLRKRLKMKDLNIDSDGELAEALDKQGLVDEWVLTPTGQRSTSKKNLGPAQLKDARVAQVLGYRSGLATCLSTFARPWLVMAEESGGNIHTSWNQVRGEEYGTRTGRPSTSAPNFLNIPKSLEGGGRRAVEKFAHPDFLKVRQLPLMRTYLLPDDGGCWLHRDYSQQELRILAHFEDGDLKAAYNDNPELDTHEYVRGEMSKTLGVELIRDPVKDLNFGYIYGMGLKSLAARMRIPPDEAKKLRNAQMLAVPGLGGLTEDIKDLAGQGLPVVTWGGREYYVEAPKFVEKFNRVMSFEYKLLNYLIQGSAADATKEAVIRHHDAGGEARFLVTVYDEINLSAPKKRWKEEMELLRECMESLEFDVPMLSDGKMGSSWGTLGKKLKEVR